MTELTTKPPLKQRFGLDSHEIERRKLWSAVFLQTEGSTNWRTMEATKALDEFDHIFPTPNEVYYV